MEDTVINLYFNYQNGGGNESNPETPGVTPNPQEPDKNRKKPNENDNALTETKAMTAYLAKQGFSTVKTRISAESRSSLRQDKIDASMKIVGYGIGFATNPIITGVALFFDLFNQHLEYQSKQRQEERTLGIIRKRAGIDRSR